MAPGLRDLPEKNAPNRPPGRNGQAARRRPHVVVVGAGFGGLSTVMALARADAEVTLVDRKNHHLFQPLLYQVATAGLAPTQIASPIRTVLRRQANVRVLLDEVTGVDTRARHVLMGGRRLAYDYLVLATGATHAYFGHDEWAGHAPGLKSLDDALALRRRVLLAFEQAEVCPDPAERSRLLTFVVVGAGPTGVELAGAIAELARRALTCDFRAIRGTRARVVLVEAGERVLPTFSTRLSGYALGALEKLGVEVRLRSAVTRCDACGVRLADQTQIEARNVVWAAGVRASPAGDWLATARDAAGRVVVGPDHAIPNRSEVFVIGDAARFVDEAGRPVPGVAPAAKQQGAFVGRLIAGEIAGTSKVRPTFRYRDCGSMATIGRKAAVAALGAVELSGFAAWLVWSLAHVYFLIGFRNRAAVVLDWVWSYLTFERGARLITGTESARPPAIGVRTVEASLYLS